MPESGPENINSITFLYVKLGKKIHKAILGISSRMYSGQETPSQNNLLVNFGQTVHAARDIFQHKYRTTI